MCSCSCLRRSVPVLRAGRPPRLSERRQVEEATKRDAGRSFADRDAPHADRLLPLLRKSALHQAVVAHMRSHAQLLIPQQLRPSMRWHSNAKMSSYVLRCSWFYAGLLARCHWSHSGFPNGHPPHYIQHLCRSGRCGIVTIIKKCYYR